MKLRIFLIVGVVALQLVIAFLSLVPAIRDLFPAAPTMRDQLNILLAINGIAVALTTALIGGLLALEKMDFDKLPQDIEQRLRKGPSRRIRDDEFYTEFLQAAKTSSDYVYISYFAPSPPAAVPSPAQQQYYQSILDIITSHGHVAFRRLVRDTTANVPWIKELIRAFEGKANASLAMTTDSGNNDAPLALSVQIVDGKRAWIVATTAHSRIATYRDLSTVDSTIAEELADYHRRLWNSSGVRLVDSGVVTPDGQTFLQRP